MKYIGIIGILVLFSCIRSNNVNKSNLIDTIFLNNQKINTKSKCFDSINKFYSKYGIVISDYYIILDSLKVDLNGDEVNDILIVLSPVTLEYKFDCNLDSTPNRFLVEIINKNGVMKIRNIYSNLISKTGGMLSKYYGLEKTKDGFIIQHSFGSKYTWFYSMEFTTKYSDSIYLIKVKKKCGLNLNEITSEYNYKKYSVNNVNIEDTLNNNCNCNKLWHELESKNNHD